MGNLLRVLYSKENTAPDIFVDFEKCQPTVKEEKVHSAVQDILDSSPSIIQALREYKGAAIEIREAISHPNDDNEQDKAWQAVVPLVSLLKRFYLYSQSLEHVVPQLLGVLCSNEMTPREHLETQQALFKQFAQILDFVLSFDDLKMTNPAIQNDFSYYRRTLSRLRMSGSSTSSGDNDVIEESNLDVNTEMANKMSLFYAHATPMMKMLSNTTTKFVSENKDLPIENTTECLSTMASICRTMIENEEYRNKFENDDTVMFCLRVMVGVIVLYDHVHPVGAFAKSSSIDMKSSIKVLKDQPAGRVEGLLNALRYTSKHLNDETTPKTIKSLLA